MNIQAIEELICLAFREKCMVRSLQIVSRVTDMANWLRNNEDFAKVRGDMDHKFPFKSFRELKKRKEIFIASEDLGKTYD